MLKFITLTIVLLANLNLSTSIQFLPINKEITIGKEWKYSLKSNGDALNLRNVSTFIRFTTTLLKLNENQQVYELKLDSVFISSPNHDLGSQIDQMKVFDYSKPFYFYVNNDGVIKTIERSHEEENHVLNIKKMVVGSLSAKIKKPETKRLKYSSVETDHAGTFDHKYTLHKESNGNFKLTRDSIQRLFQDRTHKKNMNIGADGSLLSSEIIDDLIFNQETNNEKANRNLKYNETEKDIEIGEIPKINATNKSFLELKSTRILSKTEMKDKVNNLINESIKVHDRKKFISFVEALDELEKSVPCQIDAITLKNSKKLTDCVANISSILYDLTENDIKKFAENTLSQIPSSNSSFKVKQRFETAIYIFMNGKCKTSQKMIVDYILKPKNMPQSLLSNAITLLHDIEHPIPELTSTLENICFPKLQTIRGQTTEREYEELPEIVKRSCLALGTLLSFFKNSYPKQARRIANKFHSHLYDHRPEERKLKDRLHTPKFLNGDGFDFTDRLKINKAVILHSMANAGLEESKKHLLSFAKPGTGHSIWRRAVSSGLKKYDCKESADALLKLALTDHHHHVRRTAFEHYSNHPLAYELTKEQIRMIETINSTVIVKNRSKRSISDFLEKLSFKLEIPSIDWSKSVGSSTIGASTGLISRNRMELQLKPLSGFFEIDVFNHAWGEAHVSLLRLQVTFFKVLICFNGNIKYDLNILKDFGINKLEDLTKAFDKILNSIKDPVESAIKSFTDLINISDGGLVARVKKMIELIKSLPDLAIKKYMKGSKM